MHASGLRRNRYSQERAACADQENGENTAPELTARAQRAFHTSPRRGVGCRPNSQSASSWTRMALLTADSFNAATVITPSGARLKKVPSSHLYRLHSQDSRSTGHRAESRPLPSGSVPVPLQRWTIRNPVHSAALLDSPRHSSDATPRLRREQQDQLLGLATSIAQPVRFASHHRR